LTYTLDLEDYYGKTSHLDRTIQVADDIPPTVRFLDGSGFRTGEDAWIRIEPKDNIGIKDFAVTILKNHEDNASDPLYVVPNGSYYDIGFHIEEDCRSVMCVVQVEDFSGILMEYSSMWYSVYDSIPPKILVVSPPIARRGEIFNLTFEVDENIQIRSVSISVKHDGMEYSLNSEKIDEWRYEIPLWIDHFQSQPLITIRVSDYQTWTSIDHNLELYDPDMDSIIRIDPGDPRTGEDDPVWVEKLSRFVNITRMNYSFQDGDQRHLSYPSDIIRIDETAQTLTFDIYLRDSGGFDHHHSATYPVTDCILPRIDIDHTAPECGKVLWFAGTYTDNIEVMDHWIIYDSGQGKIKVQDDDNTPTSIMVPVTSRYVDLQYYAVDRAGNTDYYNITLEVIDGIAPSIIDVRTGIVAGRIMVQVDADDNLGAQDLTCLIQTSLWSGYRTMSVNGTWFEYWIDPPDGMTNITFTIVAADPSGNEFIWKDGLVEIPQLKEDKAPHPILYWAILLFAIGLLAIVVLFVSSRLRMRKVILEE